MTLSETMDKKHQEDLQRLKGFRLMHDFSCTDPSEMYYDVLADRVKFFKESKEGVAVMCKVMEDMRYESLQEGIEQGLKQGLEQGRQEGRQEGHQEGKQEGMNAAALRMLGAGKYSLDEIAAISGLSLDEVKKLSESKSA